MRDPRENRGMHYLRGIARLKAGVSLGAANAELETIGEQLARAYPDTNSNFTPLVTPLQDVLVRSARTPLMVLLGAVFCVLLIVVANVANLLMARATVRARELAIRAALGAGRRVLVRQLLTESVLLAVVGGAFGVLLAFWGVDLILALEPGEIPRVAPIAVNGQALAFAVGLSVITGLLFGVVPAWHASRPELQSTLKDATRGTTGDGHRHLARMGLVLAEVALSLVLLVGAGLLFRSLMNLLDVSARVLVGANHHDAGGADRRGLSVAGAGDGVLGARAGTAAGGAGVERWRSPTRVPMGGSISVLSYNASGKPELPPNQAPLSHYRRRCRLASSPRSASPWCRGASSWRGDAIHRPPHGRESTRRWPGASGRGRTRWDSVSRFGPGDNGQPEWLDVVGVVGNVRQYGVDQEPVPITYVPHSASPSQPLTIMVRAAGDPASCGRQPCARRCRASTLSLPITRMRPLDEIIGASLTQRRFNMTLLAVFAGIALVLALAGIYGTVSYAVAQRTQELGIRAALGATRADVLRLVLWDGLKPVVLGLALGLAGAFVLRRTLDRLVYGVTTSDPATFVALPVLLAVVAVVASLIPALRAARVDPMTALRVD